MEYIEKDFVLSRIDKMLKGNTFTGSPRAELQKLAIDVTGRSTPKLKKDEYTVAKFTLSHTGKCILTYCGMCERVIGMDDNFCPKCGRKIVRRQQA